MNFGLENSNLKNLKYIEFITLKFIHYEFTISSYGLLSKLNINRKIEIQIFNSLFDWCFFDVHCKYLSS